MCCSPETGPWATCPQCVAVRSQRNGQGRQMSFHLKIGHYLSGDLPKTGFLWGKVVSGCILIWAGAEENRVQRSGEKPALSFRDGPATTQRTANGCAVMVRLSLLFQVTFVLDGLLLVTHILTSLVELSGLLDKLWVEGLPHHCPCV